MSAPEKRVGVIVRGVVQGVFFRESARREAERLGVRGYVKNLPTGEVQAEVVGEPSAVDDFLAWCKVGPPAARVHEVLISEPSGRSFTDFRVER